MEKFGSIESPMVNVRVSFTLRVYVSETSRAFTRMTRANARQRGPYTSDQGPTDKNARGSAGEASFWGQRLTITRMFSSGGRQVGAVFESNFSACRAKYRRRKRRWHRLPQRHVHGWPG